MFDVYHNPNPRPLHCNKERAALGYASDSQKFHGGIGSLDLLRALRSSRQKQRPLSLTVQLPSTLKALANAPQTPGCERGHVEQYLLRLEREIDLIGCHLSSEQRIEQFHLSGGTPCAAHLQRLMKRLRSRFNFLGHEGGDYSVEVDLHHTDWATMRLLRDQGFNHVSIGVPDMGADAELSVACYQNPAPIHSLIDAARTFGFRTINVDLGYGHAWQTPQSLSRKLATLIELEPDRVLAFDYAQPGPRHRALCASPFTGFSSDEDKRAMRQDCFEQLCAAGYYYIGLGQFVRPDDDLAIAQEQGRLHRNYQGFTSHGYCDLVGLGLGAISQIDDLYAQNTEDLQHYQLQLDREQLPTIRGWRCEAQDQVRHDVMERLVCDLELDIQAIERRHGLIFREYFSSVWPLLEQLSRDGLIELSSRMISILPAARLEVDAICNLFERDLDAARH